MQAIYCEKCHNKKMIGHVSDVLNKIEKMEHISSVSRSCISYCGPGKENFFALVDDELITGDTLDEMLQKIEEFRW